MGFVRCTVGLILSLVVSSTVRAQQEHIVLLSNGMILGPGVLSPTDSLSTTAFQGGSGDSGKSIGRMDDGLRLTHFNMAPNNARFEESNAAAMEQIELPSAAEVARGGNAPSIRGILGVTDFNRYGRRRFAFLTPRGRVEVLQGITLLTPNFAKLEILNTETEKFVWDTRQATNIIPAAQLRTILEQAIGMKNSSDWLRLVRFYTQAERFREARDIMAEAVQKFPTELARQAAIVDQLDQRVAQQKFEEIKLRRNAGQHLLATRFLSGFPVTELPLESQVKLQTEIDSVKDRLRQIAEIAEALKQHVAQLPEADQQVVAPIVEEILAELSQETVARLADFQRLRSDASIANESKVALAITGWMLGAGNGLNNFAVAKSLLRVRRLVREYLVAPKPRRQAILTQLRGEEGTQPKLIDELLETMKPPVALPDHQDGDPPGLYRVEASNTAGEKVSYVIQVPPEYDPNRKYPCILALPGRGDLPDLEVNYWSGLYTKLAVTTARSGYATRYGYIVISPNWMEDGQAKYNYTEGEQDRILRAMRDAFRRVSVDTDRVYISGHFDGATAAWDLAVSHPGLWAGAIMISPEAEKFIVQYGDNVKGRTHNEIPLATYIVYGQLDGRRINSKVGTVATTYLKSSLYDSLVVEYRGRGSGLFNDELPRIFEWMELSSHRRVRAPQNIEAKSMRSGDRFFYWLEAPALTAKVSGNAYQFDPASAGAFRATLLDRSKNVVNISRIPSEGKRATIWLTPEMVDFSRPVVVNMPRGGSSRPRDVTPDVKVMLEDARQRADRMHVFWQKIEI